MAKHPCPPDFPVQFLLIEPPEIGVQGHFSAPAAGPKTLELKWVKLRRSTCPLSLLPRSLPFIGALPTGALFTSISSPTNASPCRHARIIDH